MHTNKRQFMKNKLKAALQLFTLIGYINICAAQGSLANTETLQIYTNFKTFIGKPTWLLVLRDVQTGLVSPYVFDIRNKNNFWVAFSYGHSYQITASTLTFGKFAVIHNFCGLENGILPGISLYLTLTGILTPDKNTISCHIESYQNLNFTIANPLFS